MAEDPMRAKARATFGKVFMDAAKPKPLAKNAATASQKVANQRPIPTYKVGGAVKKADGGKVMADRIAARMEAGNYKDGGKSYDYKKGGKVQTSADTARKLATEMGGMKKGGACGMKPVKKAGGGELARQAPTTTSNPADYSAPPAPVTRAKAAPVVSSSKPVGPKFGMYMNSAPSATPAAPAAARQPTPSTRITPNSSIRQSPANSAAARGFNRNAAYKAFNARAGELAKQGVPMKEITRHQAIMRKLQMDNNSTPLQHQMAFEAALAALKPVKRAVGGAGKTRKDMAPIKRKQGGPARGPGGIPKEGVSTPPVAPSGRRATIDDLNKSNRDVGGMSAGQVRAAGEAIGRGNRTPREPIPKKAKGGAAKVRKGMMSQTGDIKQAVKPKKGIGGFM